MVLVPEESPRKLLAETGKLKKKITAEAQRTPSNAENKNKVKEPLNGNVPKKAGRNAGRAGKQETAKDYGSEVDFSAQQK